MLLKQLNYFATVAELGSFTEAAYALGISQSAVSQQIKALEEDLSVQLIIRNHLNPRGRVSGRAGSAAHHRNRGPEAGNGSYLP